MDMFGAGFVALVASGVMNMMGANGLSAFIVFIVVFFIAWDLETT